MTRRGAPRQKAWSGRLRRIGALVVAVAWGLTAPAWARPRIPAPRPLPPPKPPPAPGTRGPSVLITVQVIRPPVTFRDWLEPGMPNPCVSSTTIRYSCARAEQVSIRVFSVTGQRVITLVDRRHDPGSYSLWWDGRDGEGRRLAAGVYFYRMETPTFAKTLKLIMAR